MSSNLAVAQQYVPTKSPYSTRKGLWYLELVGLTGSTDPTTHCEALLLNRELVLNLIILTAEQKGAKSMVVRNRRVLSTHGIMEVLPNLQLAPMHLLGLPC